MNNPFEVEIKKDEEITLISKKIEELEIKLKNIKQDENELKDLKQQLLDKVKDTNFVTWKTPNGTKFTLVEGTEPKVEVKTIFAEILFKNDYPDLYKQYLHTSEEIKSGRKSYIKITLPKENKVPNNENND